MIAHPRPLRAPDPSRTDWLAIDLYGCVWDVSYRYWPARTPSFEVLKATLVSIGGVAEGLLPVEEVDAMVQRYRDKVISDWRTVDAIREALEAA